MSKRQRQIKTRRCTVGSIVGDRDFKRGMLDYLAGRGWPEKRDPSWNYERGRLYAAACKGEGRDPILDQREGRCLNWALVGDYARLLKGGAFPQGQGGRR